MTQRPMWVFGYGSLIWNPGFDIAERAVATLPGYARRFCMRSIHHRGSPEAPGLVLALDAAPGAACTGVAFRVASGAENATLATLRERELISSAYLERTAALLLADGRRVTALAYVIDRDHVQYSGDLALDAQAHIIAQAIGGRGPNTEYLYRTADHLDRLRIVDHEIAWLARRVRSIAGPDAGAGVEADAGRGPGRPVETGIATGIATNIATGIAMDIATGGGPGGATGAAPIIGENPPTD